MKKTVAVALLACCSFGALASDEYNLEIQYNHHNVKQQTTYGNNDVTAVERDTTDWHFTYYFDPVNIGSGPREHT